MHPRPLTALVLSLGALASLSGCSSCSRPSSTPARGTEAGASASPAGRGDAAADAARPAAPAGPTGTIEGVVILDGPIRRNPALTVPPAWRDNRGCRDAALRYSQPFEISEPGPMPGALVAAEARSDSPAPVRERRITFRDCDVVPRVTFATTSDRIVFHADTQLSHLPRLVGVESPILQALLPGQPDQVKTVPGPGSYPIVVSDLPEWAGGMLFVLANRFIDTTDVQGRFRLENVPVGNVTVHAWYLGTDEAREVVSVREGETTRVEFHLRQAPPRPTPPPAPANDAGPNVQIPG